MTSMNVLSAVFLLLAASFPQTAAADEQGGQMRAAVYTSRPWNRTFDLNAVKVIDRTIPEPGRGEVLVKVFASSMNPADHEVVEKAGLLWSYPHKLGNDVAGVVAAVGPGCARLKAGDEVWGMPTVNLLELSTTVGAFAQYAILSEDRLGIKPKSLSWVEAGSMPTVAVTSYEALHWAVDNHNWSQENVTVLVLGGSGGTGHMGIQLAKAMGAKEVITTCSGTHSEFVKSLGADRVIDYHTQNYYDVLANKSVDVIYDCVGLKGTGDLSYPLLKDNGRFITLLPDIMGGHSMPSIQTTMKRPDVKAYAPLCIGKCSHYDRIDYISDLVKEGKLKVHIDVLYDLENIVQAFNHSIAGHTTGKVGVTVTNTTGMTMMV